MGWLAVWAPTEWRRRWPALVGLAVLVAVAGGVATALMAGARRADSSFARFLDVTGAPNLVAQVALGQDVPGEDEDISERFSIGPEAVEELAAIPGVESVRVESWWAINLPGELDPPGVVTAFAIGTSVTVGEPPAPLILEGRLPAGDDPDSVIVNAEAVRVFDAPVGSTLRFRTASPDRLVEWAANDGQFASADALDGPEIVVDVAAVGRSQDDFGEDRFPMVMFPEGFARAHRDVIAHVEPALYLRIDPSRLTEARPAVEEVAGRYRLDVMEPPSAADTVSPSIGVEVTTLRIAALVAAVAGALVVATAFGRQASSITPDPGIGAALGLTRSQRRHGAWVVLTPPVIAGAIAVPVVAWGLSSIFPRGVARLTDPDPGLRFDAQTLLVGAVVTLAVASIVLTVSSVIATPQGRAARPTRARAGSWLLGSPARLLGVSFAADPTGTGRRSGLVAGATIAATTLGVAGIVTVATLDASRAHLTTSPRLFGAPAALVYESNGTFGIAEVVDAALATDGVEAVTRQIAVDEDTVTVEAIVPGDPVEIEPEAFETRRGAAVPPVVDGRFPQGADEVALGEATAAELGVGIGDTVRLAPIGDGEHLVLRVSGMVVSWDTSDPQHAFIVTPETLHRALCADLPFDECNITARVFADVATDDARTTLLDRGFSEVPAPANVDRLDQVGPVPWYLAAFLCVLAAAGVLHALMTALRRRRRDIAITRALGLTRRRAANSLVWQAVLTTLVGVATGTLLGVIVGPMLWRIIATDLGVIVRPIVPIVSVALAAAGGLTTAALLSLGPRWRAVHLPLTHALRSE